ncbi:DUF2584 family protein [Halomicronema sp. CCY15110]|uniref:DUF2584 family protein n=1 Tax=Halomicronema sp. CCY15110 TaxID=2767773 RepID=UPI00194DCCC2|nr:DUF2584 family protein [Halomicronema sp. CCY15110]
MGMPCQVNSILKLKPDQGYPKRLAIGDRHRVQKPGYRIFPLDVPLCLVDESWQAHADIVIEKLIWQQQTTDLEFRITRIYDAPFAMQ